MTFGAELQRAMTSRDVTAAAVSRATGIHPSTLSSLRTDRDVASVRTATRLAEALDWPDLVTIAVREHRSTCGVCGKVVVSRTPGRLRKTCSGNCQRVAYNRRQAARRRESIAVARHRLTEYQQVVTAFCRACEPEGLCRLARCELRSVSPLPLVRKSAA